MDYFFPGALGQRKFFEQWLAWQIQHPGERIHVAVVLYSREQGLGKSLVVEVFCEIFGTNAAIVDDDMLKDKFNCYKQRKQFLLAEEVGGRGENRKSAAQIADIIKNMITSRDVYIEEKCKPRFPIRNTINYVFTTNHSDAFLIDDHDRRFWIWEIPQDKPLPDEFYSEVVRWKNNEGPAALRYYLEHLDLTDFNPHARAPMTDAKADMIDQYRSDVDRWTLDLLPNFHRLVADYVATADPKKDPGFECVAPINKLTLVTMDEVLRLYQSNATPGSAKATAKSMGAALIKAGFKKAYRGGSVQLSPGKKEHLWIVASPEECATQAKMDHGQVVEEYKRQRPSVVPSDWRAS